MFPKIQIMLLLFQIKELNVANHCYPAIASPDIHAPPPHKPQAVNWRGEKIWRLFCAPFLIVMPSIPWDIYFTGLSSGCNTHIAPHSINTVVAGRVPATLHWKPRDWRQTGASTWHRGISLSADNLRGATWIVLVVRAGLGTQSANEWQLNKLLADMQGERYWA